MRAKKEYGDFQTPLQLAERVVALVAELFGTPELVIEPTAGLGTFLRASAQRWDGLAELEGYEINGEYVSIARSNLSEFDVRIRHTDFFAEDWISNIARSGKARVLVIGNPPWVTNSDLGQLGSDNLPTKSNYIGLRGLDARTGKSNFDIAEWMLTRLIEALPSDGALAMLCKTMTARRVLRHIWKTDGGRHGSRLFHIDAKSEFNVAVDACLFFTTGKRSNDRTSIVHSKLDTASATTQIGFLNGGLISDICSYEANKNLDGGSSVYTWRSGVKHDASKVMEFDIDGHQLINGFGDVVEIESECVFPLMKSSDLGNGRTAIRKAVLVTQRHTSDDTTNLEQKTPKTWAYLMRHADALDGRKSSIYAERPRFSVFGIGKYSFAPWKIAISGLYKKMSFSLVSPIGGRPVMVDDTCYFIPCWSEEEAKLIFELVSSTPATNFLNSLVFVDSKRPITIDVLRRLSFVELAREFGKLDRLQHLARSPAGSEAKCGQLSLPI